MMILINNFTILQSETFSVIMKIKTLRFPHTHLRPAAAFGAGFAGAAGVGLAGSSCGSGGVSSCNKYDIFF